MYSLLSVVWIVEWVRRGSIEWRLDTAFEGILLEIYEDQLRRYQYSFQTRWDALG